MSAIWPYSLPSPPKFNAILFPPVPSLINQKFPQNPPSRNWKLYDWWDDGMYLVVRKLLVRLLPRHSSLTLQATILSSGVSQSIPCLPRIVCPGALYFISVSTTVRHPPLTLPLPLVVSRALLVSFSFSLHFALFSFSLFKARSCEVVREKLAFHHALLP